MKQLGAAAFLAVTVHVLLFWVQIPWAKPILPASQKRSVTINLVKIQKAAPKPAPRPAVKNPPPKPRILPKPKPKKQPIPKPKPAPKPIKRTIPKSPSPIKPYEPSVQTMAAIEPLKLLDDVPAEPAAIQAVAPAASDLPTDESEDSPVSASQTESAAVTVAVPLYKRNAVSDYPPLARRRQYQGTVILDVLVDTAGRVVDLSIAQSSGHGILDRSAYADVQRWRFEPARKAGRPVKMWVQVPVLYMLK